MKKSLSLLLSGAMVFGLFASAVSAAESTDLTAQQKFDALKEKGIFQGIEQADGTTVAGLDQEMNRAQFARIAALLSGLDGIGVPDTKVVTEKPFSDVELGKWYTEEVAAVKEAELMIGNGDGTFGTDDKIQVQQLAVVVAKILGLEPVEDAEVEGAADWAAGYIQAIKNNNVDFPTNYTANATRGQLVEATFVADSIINPVVPADQAVASLTATGAKKLTVAFAKAVEDAAKLKFTVKKGAANVAVASEDGYKWSEDKKSVDITLASKMTAGEYTVTVAPAAEADPVVNNGTNSVTVTDEVIKTIEFLTASDTLARYNGALVKFEAKNQYGEVSDRAANGGGFTITTSVDAVTTVTKSSSKQEIALDLSDADTPKDSIVAITIVAPNGTASVAKTYRVGDNPLVSKVEVGELKFAEGKTKITAGDADAATLKITAYDQYGNVVTDNTIISTTTTLVNTRSDIIDSLTVNGGNIDILTKANSVTVDTDVRVSIVANGSGSAADATIRVHAPKLPEDFSFGEFSDTVAVGDGTIYLPIVVTDQNGDKLSASDIAGHAGKFTVYSTNSSVVNISSAAGTTNGIVTTAGPNQGKIAVVVVGKGSASVTALITTKNKQQSFSLSVQDARVPNSVEVSTEPAKKLLPNAATTLKVKIKDQYGKELPADYAAITGYTAEVSQSPSGGDAILTLGGLAGIIADSEDLKTLNNAAISLTNNLGKIGTAKVKVDLKKDATVISSITVSVETVKSSVANDLTYEVAEIGTLYASTGLAGAYPAKVSKDVTVKAKDANGIEVGLPSVIKAVYSSDTDIVTTANPKVTGIAKGTVTLTITFEPAAGIVKVASQSVTVSDVLPAAESLTVKNATQTIALATLQDGAAENGSGVWNVWDGKLGGDIELKDQYGISYKNADLNDFSDLTKIKYSVTNVDGGTVTVDANGSLTATGAVKSFVVTVYTLTNGKSVSYKVTTY